MAPKKEKLSKERFKELMTEHKIIFEGTVPPNKWPMQYKHHFHVIREIWATRYDEYKKRTDIDKRSIKKQKDRVKHLCRIARDLLQDIKTNESTWRHKVEDPVVGQFDEKVICDVCRNEKKFKSDYQAYPLDENEKAKLEKKRTSRIKCTCDYGSMSNESVNEDSDDEGGGLIFSTAFEREVSHDPNDRLENFSIPMRPDRVVGLHKTDNYQKYIESCPPGLTHYPIKGNQLLYPFLIIEAKRENDSPGFKSIEAQSAFPLKRFLKLQDDLRIARRGSIDPLVWFFAFQGEEWRLYAGIFENSNVRVFDLWHGTVESQDGALQLYQIVDFIWTWARDVYRPQLRRCLRGQDSDPRELSPTSTYPFSRSESVFSISSYQSLSHTLVDTGRNDGAMTSENGSNVHLNIRDASSHPFLRWANSHDASAPWATQTCIRHSDIVAFSFRILLMPENDEDFQSLMNLQYREESITTMLHLLALTSQSQYSVLLRRGHIYELEKDWIGAEKNASHASSATYSDDVVRAFFFFHTFCQAGDWQIKREVYCIIWSSRAAQLLSTLIDTDLELHRGDKGWRLTQHFEITRTFPQIRNLFGNKSVAYALHNASLILLHGGSLNRDGGHLQWALPPDQGMTEAEIAQYFALFNAVECNAWMSQLYHRRSFRLLQVLRTEEATEIPLGLPSVSEDIGKGGAMLAIKPNSWPSQCPRFCLFVLLENGFDDKAQLKRLLRCARKEREMYGVNRDTVDGRLSLSATDEKILKDWKNALGSETTRGD